MGDDHGYGGKCHCCYIIYPICHYLFLTLRSFHTSFFFLNEVISVYYFKLNMIKSDPKERYSYI